MIGYGIIKKGLHHADGVCEDTILLGNQVIKDGFAKVDLGDAFLIGVADGVGGLSAGQMASGMTMLSLAELNPNEISTDDLEYALEEINQSVFEIGSTVPIYKNMCSTLTVFGKLSDGQILCQFGNTRLYEMVVAPGIGAVAVQKTRDHNRLSDYIENGKDTSEIEGTPEAGILTSCIGIRNNAFTSVKDINKTFKISESFQRIFITSDGIHDHIPATILQDAFAADGEPEEILQNIINLALENGSRDDLSVVMLE